MLSHDVAASNCMKSNRGALSFAGNATTSVHCHIFKGLPSRIGDDLSQLQRRPGRRIHLVPVVGLNDLDVETRTKYRRGDTRKAESCIYADRHVRSKHNRYLLSVPPDLLDLSLRETRRSDDRGNAVCSAGFEMRKSSFRTSEINQNISSIQC